MNKQTVLLFIIVIAASGMFPSCNDLNDDYSTNPNLRLSFSVDTLTFDTVFTTIGSATQEFMIYNPHKEALNIESIRLTNTGKSGFRLNVDGRNGESFSDIYILGKDSMYVFVEVTVDPTGHDKPLLIEDQVEFITNGVKQTVLLQAHGQDVNLIKGGLVFDKDTVLSAARPYLIYDSVTINKEVVVSIEKGASFYMHNKAKWIIHGTIHATGTPEAPILFRGDRLDNLLTEVPYDRISGLWDALYVKAESFDNVMNHVIIRNSTEGIVLEESTPERPKLTITNSQITNSSKNLFTAVNCHIEAVNTEFSNTGGKLMSLRGGEYHFIHCTLVNLYRINPRDGQSTLTLANYIIDTKKETPQTKHFPLKKATFENCIIDGSLSEGKEELEGEIYLDKKNDSEFNFHFNHCAIKTKKTNNTNFSGVQFIDDKNTTQYKSVGNEDNNYINDFRPNISKDKPKEEQPIIGKADRAVAAKYPSDRLGIDRLSSEDGPDIGAYEYVAEPEKKE